MILPHWSTPQNPNCRNAGFEHTHPHLWKLFIVLHGRLAFVTSFDFSDGKKIKHEVVTVLNWLSTTPWRCTKEWKYSSNIYDLCGAWWRALYLGKKRPDTCIGDWVCPRDGLEAVEINPSCLPGIEHGLSTPYPITIPRYPNSLISQMVDPLVVLWSNLSTQEMAYILFIYGHANGNSGSKTLSTTQNPIPQIIHQI
jgi:hypothetical protein